MGEAVVGFITVKTVIGRMPPRLVLRSIKQINHLNNSPVSGVLFASSTPGATALPPLPVWSDVWILSG